MSASPQRHALGPQPLDEVEQHDRVRDHDADEHQEADERADPDRPAGQQQRREGADGGQRQAEQDDERRDQRAEGEHEHQVDEDDGDAHGGEQAAERLRLLLAHAADGDRDARRQLAGGLERVELGVDRRGDAAGVLADDLGR